MNINITRIVAVISKDTLTNRLTILFMNMLLLHRMLVLILFINYINYNL